MKQFLSIGQMARIMGVTPKALRYYERLGILIPAYIKEQSGYRYYTTDQLMLVGLIATCVDFGIPLKDFTSFIKEDNQIDLEKFLQHSSRIVDEKLKTLLYEKAFLSDMTENVKRANRIKTITGTFTETFPDRYFLTLECNGGFKDHSEISLKYTKLFYQCKSLNLSDGFNQGLVFLQEEDKLTKNAFLQVSAIDKKPENLYIVPAGSYLCKVVGLDELEKLTPDTPGLIIKELIELTISPDQRLFEIQKPQKRQ